MERTDDMFTKEDGVGFDAMSKEKLREVSSKGGKASGAKRRQNATFKQALEWALDMPAMRGNKAVEKIRKQYPDLSNREAIAISMVHETIKKGDAKAFVAVRDTTGELPAQTVNIEQSGPLAITIETIDARRPEEDEDA